MSWPPLLAATRPRKRESKRKAQKSDRDSKRDRLGRSVQRKAQRKKEKTDLRFRSRLRDFIAKTVYQSSRGRNPKYPDRACATCAEGELQDTTKVEHRKEQWESQYQVSVLEDSVNKSKLRIKKIARCKSPYPEYRWT